MSSTVTAPAITGCRRGTLEGSDRRVPHPMVGPKNQQRITEPIWWYRHSGSYSAEPLRLGKQTLCQLSYSRSASRSSQHLPERTAVLLRDVGATALAQRMPNDIRPLTRERITAWDHRSARTLEPGRTRARDRRTGPQRPEDERDDCESSAAEEDFRQGIAARDGSGTRAT